MIVLRMRAPNTTSPISNEATPAFRRQPWKNSRMLFHSFAWLPEASGRRERLPQLRRACRGLDYIKLQDVRLKNSQNYDSHESDCHDEVNRFRLRLFSFGHPDASTDTSATTATFRLLPRKNSRIEDIHVNTQTPVYRQRCLVASRLYVACFG